MELSPQFFLQVLQIIWIDLLLSGDNAVVIALACRSLPEKQRRWGMILGAGTAVGLRIIFAMMITYLLQVPFLKLVGGLLLFWIAIKLLKGEDDGGHDIADSDSLWKAVRTIAIADAVMSLDNVVAIAAASHGNVWLFVFGLLLSIPLIIWGSALIMGIIERYPLFIWAGAALLGWIAGEMIVSDPWVASQISGLEANLGTKLLHYGAAAIGALLVIASGFVAQRRQPGEAA